MSNFAFVKQALPTLHESCHRAESQLTSDPRAACFYSRRAVESLTRYLYEVLGLPTPYKPDLAALMNDAGFKAAVGQGIATKLNLIRRVANTAVHEERRVPARTALDVVRELHHVMVWAAFHHSTTPGAAPTTAAFDPKLAAKAAPLSREELVQLAAKFKAQDEAYAKALAEKEAEHEAEIDRLRAEIAAAQAANARTDDRDYDEAETRDLFIDVLLHEVGWALEEPRDREYEVAGMPNGQGRGFVDYVLWGADGLPLAVVEAKRTTKSPQVGQQQAKLYADCLEQQFGRRPVIFYTNGYEHWLWDDAAGFPPREVSGFYTRGELELMVQRRTSRLPLGDVEVDTDIAGRHYQQRAIRAVGDAFEKKQREALLVMATGSGKTRMTIALVDQLMKAGWVKRVLFLADRNALVTQAVNAFKGHLPSAPVVNLVTERVAEARAYVSTYPTMMNLIDSAEEGRRRFGPGYFDLIVIDEAHRSVYKKYGAIFDWFDAMLLGLTATPKDEVDHNTYRLFHLEDGVPTDAYSLDEAVAEGYLVPPVGISIPTKFTRGGIKYADLSEAERDEWDMLDWGEDGPPDEIDSEELNKWLFNEDTVDKVLATVMEKGYRVAGNDRLAKTIVFAKNQRHADFIAQRFDEQYPHLAGHFARVITHGSPYAQSLIDDFSQPEKAPHMAISVDMLDTGIDVPEVANLVFFKMVRSKSKFWQMIGRGTRLRPDLFGPGAHKADFYVFDVCLNLEYFSQDLPGVEGSAQKSLTQRLFETRLGLVVGLDRLGIERELRSANADLLHEFVTGMTLDNFLVRPHRRMVETYADRRAWDAFSAEDIEDILDLAGLPSSAQGGEEPAKRFDVLVMRRQLAQLDGDALTAERIRETIQQIAANLLTKTTIPTVAAEAERLEAVAGDEWWVDVTLPMLELVRQRLRGLVQFLDRIEKNIVYTDFEDEIGDMSIINLPGTIPGANFERFRAKVSAYLRDHQDHAALQRLRRNKKLTPDDLVSLENMLVSSGSGDRVDLQWAAEKSGGLGLFIRGIVGLDRAAASEAFASYLDEGKATADQVRLINLIIDELTHNGIVDPGRLYEPPYTDRGDIDRFFPDEADIYAIADILRTVKANAAPQDVA